MAPSSALYTAALGTSPSSMTPASKKRRARAGCDVREAADRKWHHTCRGDKGKNSGMHGQCWTVQGAGLAVRDAAGKGWHHTSRGRGKGGLAKVAGQAGERLPVRVLRFGKPGIALATRKGLGRVL